MRERPIMRGRPMAPSRPEPAPAHSVAKRARGRWPILIGMVLLLSTGCASVQPWQKESLALDPMAAEDRPCHRFEHNNEVYREGAVGANGGKGGGGCGCT